MAGEIQDALYKAGAGDLLFGIQSGKVVEEPRNRERLAMKRPYCKTIHIEYNAV